MTEQTARLIAYLIVPLASAFAYMRLARSHGIIDKPNERSSHMTPVVRGGGVVFPVSWLAYSLLNGFAFPYFTAGLILISVVSFIDDIRSQSPLTRFLSHLSAFTLCFHELGLWQEYAPWAIALMYVVGIGALNAINFMDGINGMTGMYALAMFAALLLPITGFDWQAGTAASSPIIPMLLSVAVFGWYNFRRKALCFAGDVGSISIGFIMIFLLLALMTGRDAMVGLNMPRNEAFDWSFILWLGVYGVDSVVTILHRLILRENIFQAHRRHLFQHLANERGIPHLKVSMIYAVVQFCIDLTVIGTDVSPLVFILILTCLTLTYVWLKFIRPVETVASGNRS
jgi:UDP-N-acetylmuramyl pentapeptide phosphotransferase/UDP-N-acetylglucosamine-1-phosphate transferase